jgi:uroporphyrinogen-III decarboxylase
MLRRNFLRSAAGAAAAPALLRAARLSPVARVDRALAGKDLDRPPFTFWHHFGLKTAEEHAARTLAFHRAYHTDIVKVMSDFPYPRPDGKWYELEFEANPYPQQIRALELIRDGLGGSNYMIETVFNPWNVARKLSSKEELFRLKEENPQALLDALDVITRSQVSHARRALATGAVGVLFSIDNANHEEMSPGDYEKFSRPFDKRFLEGVGETKLTFLHLHVQPGYLEFFHDFEAPVLNYSVHVSQIPMAEVRKQFPNWVIAGGIDEVNYRKLADDDLRRQWQAAAQAAGRKFILTPGCSVPNDCTAEELARLPNLLHA